MTSVPQLILKTLKRLSSENLDTFKWYLKDDGLASAADLEKAKATTDTVDLMIARRRPEGAVKITLDILRKMDEINLAEHLENKNKGNYNSMPKMTLHLLQGKQAAFLCRV